ncbi:MAG: peptidoglycan editing factor PgeF [Deltaproteobacteria bacterium]|nr:peptidoglycan editing factor PgeF [Deltaproteobacteria bacterium]
MLREREKNGVRYFVSDEIDDAGGAIHAFLTRKGGVSSPPFASLNFDARAKDRDADTPENIARNRSIFADAMGLSGAQMKRLVILNQVHGVRIITVDAGYDFEIGVEPPQGVKPPQKDADAVITDVIGTPIGILTADCLPVLLYDPVKKAVGAAHAGWKGAYQKIGALTVAVMRERFGSDPGDIRAALGPFIGPCCYAVKDDVRAKFKEAFGSDAGLFFSGQDGLRLDIGKANVKTLLDAGLREENIAANGPCTACNSGLFFSYRKENGRTGRQISVIMLREARGPLRGFN